MNREKVCLHGGAVFDGERLIERGTVLFDETGIEAVLPGDQPSGAGQCFHVEGALVIPGLVDLHSDALEKLIEMRPGVYFDSEFALHYLDQRLALCGITTFCHGISFADSELGLRSCEEAERLVRLIRCFSRRPGARVRHRVHARYEITSRSGAAVIERLAEEGFLDLVSLMDHTPGQGQFKTMESYIVYKTGTYGVEPEEVVKLAEGKMARREDAMQAVERVARKVCELGLPFLSHDDDTADKVELVRGLGVKGSEFPVAMEAQLLAKAREMDVFMGAPNLLRDRSSNGHLKASDAVTQGLCDGMVSDYYPESLIQVPFVAHRRHGVSLEEALGLVTCRPGRFLDPQGQAGRLTPGTTADVLVIDPSGPWPSVLQTWVSGRLKLSQV